MLLENLLVHRHLLLDELLLLIADRHKLLWSVLSSLRLHTHLSWVHSRHSWHLLLHLLHLLHVWLHHLLHWMSHSWSTHESTHHWVLKECVLTTYKLIGILLVLSAILGAHLVLLATFSFFNTTCGVINISLLTGPVNLVGLGASLCILVGVSSLVGSVCLGIVRFG